MGAITAISVDTFIVRLDKLGPLSLITNQLGTRVEHSLVVASLDECKFDKVVVPTVVLI